MLVDHIELQMVLSCTLNRSSSCADVKVVLYSTVWYEGTITSIDGDNEFTVKYDDNDDDTPVNIGDIKAYKLIADALCDQQCSQADEWICVSCNIWHSPLDGPKEKICCSQCKVPVSQIGVLFSKYNRRQLKSRTLDS